MKSIFNKLMLFTLCFCHTAAFASAQTFPITDEFDATDPGWSTPAYDPTGSTGNQSFDRNVDISSITGPTIDTPDGSDGKVLTMEVNAIDSAAQNLTTHIGSESWTDYIVECLALPWIAEGVTEGTSEFFSIGMRATDYGDSGYFLELRTDESGTYGAYINFIKYVGSVETIIERIFFKRGTDTAWPDSPVINLNPGGDNIPATYVWIHLKLEAIGDTINIYVQDMDTPVVEYTDEEPIASGKACLFQTDPWSSTSQVKGIIDWVKIYEQEEEPPEETTSADSAWTLYE